MPSLSRDCRLRVVASHLEWDASRGCAPARFRRATDAGCPGVTQELLKRSYLSGMLILADSPYRDPAISTHLSQFIVTLMFANLVNL